MGAQSHGTPEQGNITVSLLSLTKSEFLVAVTEGKTSFPFYKLVSNGSSTSLNLNSGNLQPRVNISFRSTALKASQMTHRNTLESLSTAVVTKPLMMGTKTKTVQDSTYPVTVNTGLQPSLPRSSNTSVGAPLEIVSSLGIVLPDRPTAIEKADLSIFSTVPTTKAGRQFANVLHSITRMLQLNAVDKYFTPFSGMTASNHSAILNLPDLESGLATIRTNRSRRTLPTGYSNIFLTEPAHMRNSRCLTCTSAAPVVSGNELVHSFSTMASGSTSNTPGPANILYEWASYLNGGSGDWPIVTLSVSDIKVTPPCYKHTSEIPPRGLASAPTTDYKKMEDVLGSSAMINATERIFDSQVQLDLGREDKMPSTFLAQEIENTDSARYSDVATPHVVTASSVGSSDLFSTKDASWTAKLHPFSMETNSSDWLTSTVFSSLPDFPKRFNVPDPLQPTGTEASNHVAITVSENVLPSAITAAVTHRGNLSTRAIANLTLVEKQTVPPIAQAISITERRADPDTRTSYVLKHDPSISPSRPLVVLPETAESNSSSVFTITATHANMQHTVLDHKHLISSMRGGETIAVAAGSFSVTKLLDSSVAENMNIPIQTACQNATCAESSYVSLLQLNVTTASKVSSRLKTSLLKTANVFSGTADKLSPPNMNITSKKGVAFIFPPKTSTMANCLNISSSVSPSLQPHTVSLQHNYTATAHNYNITAVSKAPHWVSTSVVLLNVTSSTHLHHVKLPTFHSRVMTTTPNSSLTLASLGAQKAHTSKTKSTGTVYYRYHAASPRIHLKATRVLSNYTTLFDPLSTETESSVAALLSNTIATHSDFHNVTTYKLFLDHKRTSLPLKREGVSSSISKNLSSSSTRSVQNVTMSSWSLSAPTKHLGTRPSESLTSTVARSFTTIPISLLTSAVDHLGTKQTSSKIEARSTSIFITDPLIAESVVSSKYSFRSTKRMAPLSRFDPLFVRQLTTTLKNFTTIQSLTSKTSGWMASTTETDPTLLESLVPELNVPLFEMPTKNEPSLDELACTTLGTLPLRYRLTGIPYTEELQNKSAAAYKKLEHEVILTLNKIIFSRYGRRYLQTNVLHFLNGSVVVECEIKFRQDLPIPSSSDIIRTVVTEVYKKTSAFFNWSIDIHSLQSKSKLHPKEPGA
ncbi:uncharacterized protein LOC115457306 isoform X2 [Microcaecilia unicolor]|uniref:Uncharacterized protein LOC115457306 isoform X2 n=1 Tax=Microcaecilia unicolor TaxID=1415580 RepID=A0A6P7WNF7_9AMPH|nr:uncharacterized protein LOC115457306 isoform X2 [Microcaecilia unicolor]